MDYSKIPPQPPTTPSKAKSSDEVFNKVFNTGATTPPGQPGGMIPTNQLLNQYVDNANMVPTEELSSQFLNLQDSNLKFIEELFKERPKATGTMRENAYGCLAMLWFATLSGEVALPLAGTAIGGGIGLIVGTVGVLGAGAGVFPGWAIGLAAGSAIGFGVGVAADIALLVLAGVVTVPLVFYIEDKFPRQPALA